MRSSKISRFLANQYVLLTAATLLAALLRFYKLGEWSFWIDELHTLEDILVPNDESSGQILSVLLDQPGTYALIFRNFTRFWISVSLNLFGITEWGGRLAPAIIGIVSIPILYVPTKKIFNSTTGLLAAFFLAVSPWHIWMSQNVRYYPALLLFYTLAVLTLYLALDQNPWYIVLTILFLGLATLERMFALLFVPTIFVYLVFLKIFTDQAPKWFSWRNIAILTAIPVIMYFVFEAYTIFVLHEPAFISVFVSDKFLGSQTFGPRTILVLNIFSIGSPLVILGSLGGLVFALNRKPQGVIVTLAAMLPILIIVVLSLLFFTALHYTLVTLYFWILLAAFGLQWLYLKSRRGILLPSVTLLAILAFFSRDHVVRSFGHYFFQSPFFAVLFVMIPSVTVVLAWWAVRQRTKQQNMGHQPVHSQEKLFFGWSRINITPYGGIAVWALVCAVVSAYLVTANYLYFSFQRGYRDTDWKLAGQIINANKQDNDQVVSVQPKVMDFYMKNHTLHLSQDRAALDQLMVNDHRVWFITDELWGDIFSQTWPGVECEFVDGFTYFKGQAIVRNVYLCNSNVVQNAR